MINLKKRGIVFQRTQGHFLWWWERSMSWLWFGYVTACICQNSYTKEWFLLYVKFYLNEKQHLEDWHNKSYAHISTNLKLQNKYIINKMSLISWTSKQDFVCNKMFLFWENTSQQTVEWNESLKRPKRCLCLNKTHTSKFPKIKV